nr:hypothetical protein [Tanacetum cinerariifolium]
GGRIARWRLVSGVCVVWLEMEQQGDDVASWWPWNVFEVLVSCNGDVMEVLGQPTPVLVKWLPFTNRNSNEAQTGENVMSSSPHSTIVPSDFDIENIFSSTNILNYFSASPGSISPDSSSNFTKYLLDILVLSPLHDDSKIEVIQAYDTIPPPQLVIALPAILPPSLVLSLSPMFDSQDLFPSKKISPKDTETPVESLILLFPYLSLEVLNSKISVISCNVITRKHTRIYTMSNDFNTTRVVQRKCGRRITHMSHKSKYSIHLGSCKTSCKKLLRPSHHQAIQTILLDLLEDIYAAVDSYETAQEIWLRVQ